jgi:hypothetical protein
LPAQLSAGTEILRRYLLTNWHFGIWLVFSMENIFTGQLTDTNPEYAELARMQPTLKALAKT